MPVYSYKFEDGLVLEVIQKMVDPPHTMLSHPKSGELEPVKRIPNAPSLTFKGSGFYKTDKKKA